LAGHLMLDGIHGDLGFLGDETGGGAEGFLGGREGGEKVLLGG